MRCIHCNEPLVRKLPTTHGDQWASEPPAEDDDGTLCHYNPRGFYHDPQHTEGEGE